TVPRVLDEHAAVRICPELRRGSIARVVDVLERLVQRVQRRGIAVTAHAAVDPDLEAVEHDVPVARVRDLARRKVEVDRARATVENDRLRCTQRLARCRLHRELDRYTTTRL